MATGSSRRFLEKLLTFRIFWIKRKDTIMFKVIPKKWFWESNTILSVWVGVGERWIEYPHPHTRDTYSYPTPLFDGIDLRPATHHVLHACFDSLLSDHFLNLPYRFKNLHIRSNLESIQAESLLLECPLSSGILFLLLILSQHFLEYLTVHQTYCFIFFDYWAEITFMGAGKKNNYTTTIKVFVVALRTIGLLQRRESRNPTLFDVHFAFFVAKKEWQIIWHRWGQYSRRK